MKRTLLLMVGVSALFPRYLNAQTGDNSALESVETRQSMMSKNGAADPSGLYNVDLYSGTANVNIPIYEQTVNNINLGVSLSYSAGGTRVDDRATSCGLGFNLNAGGFVQREVHGIEDEITIPTSPKYPGSWIPTPQGSSDKDSEHDLFTAVFGGRTIKFELGNPSPQGYSIKMEPKSGIYVKTVLENYYYPGMPWNGTEQPFPNDLYFFPMSIDSLENQNVLKFYIYDEAGNTFVFRRGDYERKIVPVGSTGSYEYFAPQRWNLVQVITAGGLTVNYTYTPVNTSYSAYKTEQVKEVYNNNVEPAGIYPVENKVVTWQGVTSNLTKIEYPNGVTLDFIYRTDLDVLSAMPKALDKIVVSGKYDANVGHKITHQFSYSFFQSPWKTYTAKVVPYSDLNGLKSLYPGENTGEVLDQIENGLRLKLDKITTTSEDGSLSFNAYTFGYNLLTVLPQRLSPSRDYYGFANGKQPVNPQEGFLQNVSIPLHSYMNGLTTYGVDKAPDFNYTKACILEKVTSSTGGTIELYYKEHNLYNSQAAYRGYLAGYVCCQGAVVYPTYEGENANDGVCIDRIVLKDGFNNNNTTATKYEFSGGQRFMRGGYSWFGKSGLNNNIDVKIYTNNFVQPMQFVNGANHGYTYAEEKRLGLNNQLLGSTKYHFTNLLLETDTNQSMLSCSVDPWKNVYPVYRFYQYRMGKPLDVITYDYAGNPLKGTSYIYEDSIGRELNGYLSYQNRRIDLRNAYVYYNFIAIPFRPITKIQTTYTNNGAYTETVNYTYDQYARPLTASWLDEFANPSLKKYYYQTIGGTTVDLPSGSDITKTVGGVNYYVDAIRNGYDLNQGRVRFKQSSRLANDGLTTVTSNPSLRLNEQITGYDEKSNPVEVKIDDNDIYKASIWDTRVGQKVATVDNAKYNEIAYSSFEGPFKPWGVADDNKGNWEFNPSQVVYIAPGAPIQPMTGHYYYQLDGSGIESKIVLATNKKYLVTFWANSLPSISGATVSQPLTAHLQKGSWTFYSTEVLGTGSALRLAGNTILIDELRLYPSDANMTTNTYEPLFGPNSSSDASGNIIYTEYDGMGRKTVVRDIDRNVLSVTKQVIRGADNY